MIPKTIHYCWFGGNKKPSLAKKCFRSWKKYCPDYKIIEWNESNYDLSKAPLYVRQAYDHKKWAFVTDFVRLQIIYEHGGIYLDTDVEVIKSLDELLLNYAYFGFEEGINVNTGLGFGAEKGCLILKDLMDDYYKAIFVKSDGSYDTTTCPVRNTKLFLKYGLVQDDSMQLLRNSIRILPSDYLCPKSWRTGMIDLTDHTFSIHHNGASWYTPEMRRRLQKKHIKEYIRRMPSMIGNKIFGHDRYELIRQWIKQKLKKW